MDRRDTSWITEPTATKNAPSTSSRPSAPPVLGRLDVGGASLATSVVVLVAPTVVVGASLANSVVVVTTGTVVVVTTGTVVVVTTG
ncbi:MAG: hypothetical protein ACH37H_18365, partial [Ilumatobacteraceae bacterium]